MSDRGPIVRESLSRGGCLALLTAVVLDLGCAPKPPPTETAGVASDVFLDSLVHSGFVVALDMMHSFRPGDVVVAGPDRRSAHAWTTGCLAGIEPHHDQVWSRAEAQTSTSGTVEVGLPQGGVSAMLDASTRQAFSNVSVDYIEEAKIADPTLRSPACVAALGRWTTDGEPDAKLWLVTQTVTAGTILSADHRAAGGVHASLLPGIGASAEADHETGGTLQSDSKLIAWTWKQIGVDQEDSAVGPPVAPLRMEGLTDAVGTAASTPTPSIQSAPKGNVAACKEYVEALNAAACATSKLDVSAICNDALDRMGCDISGYFQCMATSTKCDGPNLDRSGGAACGSPVCPAPDNKELAQWVGPDEEEPVHWFGPDDDTPVEPRPGTFSSPVCSVFRPVSQMTVTMPGTLGVDTRVYWLKNADGLYRGGYILDAGDPSTCVDGGTPPYILVDPVGHMGQTQQLLLRDAHRTNVCALVAARDDRRNFVLRGEEGTQVGGLVVEDLGASIVSVDEKLALRDGSGREENVSACSAFRTAFPRTTGPVLAYQLDRGEQSSLVLTAARVEGSNDVVVRTLEIDHERLAEWLVRR